VIPKFVRKKFAGVQQPLGRWILRHVFEFIVLSPAILVTWLWLKIRHKEVLILGKFSSSITNFVAPLDPVLRRKSQSPSGLANLIVLNLRQDANEQIRKMYSRVVRIYGSERKILRRIIWWCSFVVKNVPHVDILECQNNPVWHNAAPVISLSQDEISRGNKFLDSIGISAGQEFICYTVRTDNYYKNLIAEGNVLKPQKIRNPDENIYLQVARKLRGDGFKIIRMGKDLNTKLNSELRLEIFDYAYDCRSDFMDVFLLTHCKFLLNGGTGSMIFRAVQNLGSVEADLYRVQCNLFKGDVGIFQKVWLVRENRLATVSEMVAMGDSFSDERHQERLGVRLVKNTAEEIIAACDEMKDRLNGTWVTTEEDEIQQKKYWDLICDSGHYNGRIGAQFLRDNQDLLR